MFILSVLQVIKLGLNANLIVRPIGLLLVFASQKGMKWQNLLCH